ncbi:hypothetical protein [Sulfitobacter sp. W074]|uniref:hypothetical protein n=1 Tax=Sulfitobacter sp. W074 TaxID=2867026 RepID=UPI0021A70969|nr:hypothetical protein [Sulfitobacter sp. W074]UWR38412.1 hypothetical protein K3762_05100 [Sulfitobacter sp. W074]
MPDLDWPIPDTAPEPLGDHLFAVATVKWVFDVASHRVEDFHQWLANNEEALARELAEADFGVGYVGTYGVVDPASGYDAVRRYRTYWTFKSAAALEGWNPDADTSDSPPLKRVNELASYWMADRGSWEEIYIPAALGPSYKFAGEYKYLPRGKLM